MKKLVYILFLVPAFAVAQGEMNNNPPPVNPQAQQVQPANVNQANQIDINSNEDVEQVQSPGNDGVQKDKNGKEPPCKECEEIKKLKQEQMAAHGSGITSGNGKTKHSYFRKFCARTSKKWGRAFSHRKKIHPDYSCFNW